MEQNGLIGRAHVKRAKNIYVFFCFVDILFKKEHVRQPNPKEAVMKYGEIKWKVEKIVFKIDGGMIKRKFEVDEGRTFIKKTSDHVDLCLGLESTSTRTV